MNLNINMSDFDKQYDEELNRIKKVCRMNMQKIGETYIATAREAGNYKDQTGNLRSSIGYSLVEDGKATVSTIHESDKGTDRKTGVATGRDFMDGLSSKSDTDMELIVAAGMDYASKVEGKGYDVASSGFLAAENEAKRLFK